MKLENELTYDKGASFALAWAFTWRWMILMLLISVPIYFIESAIGRIHYSWAIAIAEFIILILGMWLVVHRVLNKGFARIKIVLMEESCYEDLVKENARKQNL